MYPSWQSARPLFTLWSSCKKSSYIYIYGVNSGLFQAFDDMFFSNARSLCPKERDVKNGHLRQRARDPTKSDQALPLPWSFRPFFTLTSPAVVFSMLDFIPAPCHLTFQATSHRQLVLDLRNTIDSESSTSPSTAFNPLNPPTQLPSHFSTQLRPLHDLATKFKMSDGEAHAPGVSKLTLNPNVTPIDKDGDLILVMGDPWTSSGPKYLISSRLLSLASKFFADLFKPYLEEGARAKLGREVQLDEKDAVSMKILLSVLHYHDSEKYETLSLPSLLSLARMAKKYECGKALKPWATQWFRNTGRDLNQVEYGELMLAAYYFNNPALLKTISVGAIKTLPVGFRGTWHAGNFATALPRKVKGRFHSLMRPLHHADTTTDALALKIQYALRSLRDDIEGGEPSLRRCQDFYTTRKITCPYCARIHSEGTKYCHNCKNDDLFVALCTKQSRVAEYFSYLSFADVWPTVQNFQEVSITELVSRIDLAKEKTETTHWCKAKGRCPLKIEMKNLVASAQKVLSGVEGVEVEFT